MGRFLAAAPALALAACFAQPAPISGDPSQGLVFVRSVEGSAELMRARVSDGAQRSLTRTREFQESWPYWSQSAGQLVFQREARHGNGASDLYLWSADGRERALTRTPERDERWPAWSPDGRRIAFAFRGGEPASGVALLELESGRSVMLAAAGERDFFLRPHFAPDGARVVAQRRGADGLGSTLWLLGGDAPVPLTRDPGWFDLKAHFTRDGDAVIYSRRPSLGGPTQLARVSVTGDPPRSLIADAGAENQSGQASPSRDELAFVSDRDGSRDVFLAELSGAGVRNLTRSPNRDEFAPRWSPDGEFLVATVSPAGSRADAQAAMRVVVMDRGGRVLLDVPGLMPDWMPAWR